MTRVPTLLNNQRIPSLQNPNTLPSHDESARHFAEGDRVIAPARPGFPAGTVMKLMTGGYVLVRWDANVMETSYCGELDRAG